MIKGVRRRCKNRGEYEGYQDGVLSVLRQGSRINDPHLGKEQDNIREFKDKTKGEDKFEAEVDVFAYGNECLKVLCPIHLVFQQESQREGKNNKKTKGRSYDEKQGGRNNEGPHIALFIRE